MTLTFAGGNAAPYTADAAGGPPVDEAGAIDDLVAVAALAKPSTLRRGAVTPRTRAADKKGDNQARGGQAQYAGRSQPSAISFQRREVEH